MKFTVFCGGSKKIVHILWPNLGHWKKELILSLFKLESMAHISSGPARFWHETGQFECVLETGQFETVSVNVP